MIRLAPGMTVQRAALRGQYMPRHYALCVRCGWMSSFTGYRNAHTIASKIDSHKCVRRDVP